jgi:hypothetical protein
LNELSRDGPEPIDQTVKAKCLTPGPNQRSAPGIVHESATFVLRDFFPQIRQPNIRAKALNQILFSILAGTSAFGARQADNLAGVVAELERSSNHHC